MGKLAVCTGLTQEDKNYILTESIQICILTGIMIKVINDSKLLAKLAPSLGGVFVISEIATAIAEQSKVQLYRRIRQLEKAEVLQRFSRGVYLFCDEFSVEYLSQKLADESYISFGSVLSEHLIIGVKPLNQIDAIKVGKTRIYKDDTTVVRQFGCSKQLFFGYENSGGIKKATPEKALLDTLYFYQHGVEFYFDIYSDVDYAKLDQKKLVEFLDKYKNPKFRNFVKGLIK